MLSFGLLVATILPLVTLLLLRLRVSLALRTVRGGRRTIAFLHPYCNDGGGGERVLWVAIRELLARAVIDPARWRIVVYTGDPVSDDEIRAHALRRFGVAVPEQVEFVRLAGRGWIEPKRYPVATLLGQAFGSLVLAAEAIARVPPDVLVDTTGLHFCLPLLRAAGVPRLACYVHYPLISSDMLGAVASRKAAHNNASLFARFQATAALKLAYYHVLVFLYRCAGRMSDCTVANGSWTAAHVRSLWGVEVRTVFPPCDTHTLQLLPLEPTNPSGRLVGRDHLILSVAQFRPEKDHQLQLRAFARLLRAWRRAGAPAPRPQLVLAGAVRHAADQARLDALHKLASLLLGSDTQRTGAAVDDPQVVRRSTSPRRIRMVGRKSEREGAGGAEAQAAAAQAAQAAAAQAAAAEEDEGAPLDMLDAVRFAPNLPYAELQGLLARAKVGLHTMWNEHFGIGIVEMLAAGVVPVAHNSGGPALDIIEDRRTGRLATTEKEYADAMEELLLTPGAEPRRRAMAAAGRASVATRFSEAAFAEAMVEALRPVLA
jgi:alpha-1,2-mannosyltransferase